MENPFGEKLAARGYQLDAHGLLIPAASRFPDAAKNGFRPLADWVHAKGLKFGIHIVRGIPKDAVARNLPVAGSRFRAADAADISDTCPWDDGNYGVADNAAGQAYYDSMFRLYARWGLDFVKVDCIADHPYRASEIRQIALAIQRSGRPMALSLSPGPAQIEHAAELARYAQMWRISNDVWDGWNFTYAKPADDFPNGIVTAFDNLAKWNPYRRPGRWPDADMLPIGMLMPHPGWGDPRASRLTQDEARTQFTLWAVARSPLILGANLTKLDDATRTMITNPDIIALDQDGSDAHPVTDLPPGFDHVRVWETTQRGKPVLAVFNLDDAPVTLDAKWAQFGLPGGAQSIRDLWTGGQSQTDELHATLPAHASAVYAIGR
jgi:hypothetical protein